MRFFEDLDGLPYNTHINIGFESADAPTLAHINKPVEISRIHHAFKKMLEVNRNHAHIEITANFLLGEQLPGGHVPSLFDLLAGAPENRGGKGAIYMSPLMDSHNPRPLVMDDQKRRDLQQTFMEIKKRSRLPAYLYLIQRL